MLCLLCLRDVAGDCSAEALLDFRIKLPMFLSECLGTMSANGRLVDRPEATLWERGVDDEPIVIDCCLSGLEWLCER